MNGLYLIKPTSIVSTGTGNSSSINTNGSVTFSACETLSLNGVFSADYDNYQIVVGGTGSVTRNIWLRFRASGTDATGSNYTRQYLYAASTTVGASRNTETFGYCGALGGTLKSGTVVSVYGPHLAQPTAWRNVCAVENSGVEIQDFAGTHSLSTSYDGFTLSFNNGGGESITGRVAVYGMVK